jgi:hypothetical protein
MRRHFLARITMGAFSLPFQKIFTEEQLRFFESGVYADE